MKFKNFKFDRGWKILVYFDLALPLVLFLLALLFPVAKIQTFFSMLFHSYNLYIVKPIPDFAYLTGIVGLLYHLGAIVYGFKKRNWRDLFACLLITAAIALFFLYELNYQVIKPLNFHNF